MKERRRHTRIGFTMSYKLITFQYAYEEFNSSMMPTILCCFNLSKSGIEFEGIPKNEEFAVGLPGPNKFDEFRVKARVKHSANKRFGVELIDIQNEMLKRLPLEYNLKEKLMDLGYSRKSLDGLPLEVIFQINRIVNEIREMQ